MMHHRDKLKRQDSLESLMWGRVTRRETVRAFVGGWLVALSPAASKKLLTLLRTEVDPFQALLATEIEW